MESLPTISHQEPDGTLVELLYDPEAQTTAFAVCAPDGSVSVQPAYEPASGGRLIPYSPQNSLISSGCVLLPSTIGELGDTGDVVDNIRAYLGRYVDLSDAFMDIAPYYALLSWVYDAFNELPYLRFQGDWGTGKTRALLALGSICCKPFFASGASTVSPIFHILDTFGGTLVLDEADFRFSDQTAELTKVLNNGNVRGLPVLRTMTNRHRELNPRAFRVFGPKLIAMRGTFSDAALESRFLTERTGTRPLPPEIPIALPDSMAREARELRNRLLVWRFAHRFRVAPNPAYLIPGAAPRANQIALPLLSLIDDTAVRERIIAHGFGGEARDAGDRAQAEENDVLAAILEAFDAATAPYVSIADVAERYSRKTSGSSQIPLSNKSVGSIVRARLHVATTKTRGIYVIPQREREHIEGLARNRGLLNHPQSPSEGNAPA